MRQRIEQTPVIVSNFGPIYYTVSIGITMVNYDKETLDDAIKHAATALYSAKSAGRNLVMKAG